MNKTKNTRRMLLVDDDPLLKKTLVPLLEDLSCTCSCAATGDEAVDLMLEAAKEQKPFDIIILDLWVPRKTGGQIDRQLGLLLLNTHYQILAYGTPVIVFTNHPTFENCVNCIKAGAYDYLPKVAEEGNNTEKLLLLCRKLLFPEFTDDERSKWVKEHAAQLRERFAGKYVALIREAVGREAKLDQEPLDGWTFLVGESKQGIALKMLTDPILRWETPYVVDLTPH
ncbi:MAG: response regulator [Verrucomicrobia bacterium]|nr:response regulator [Verrucomicrobiota bacterium]